jgi:hypothetical protein
MLNKILDADNAPIKVTNLFVGAGVLNPTHTFQGLPVGTVGDAVNGEIVLKVSIREGAVGGGGGGGAATIADGADTALGTTTNAPVADNTTATSATAATGIALFKRLVNLGIAILAKQPAIGTYVTTVTRVTTGSTIPAGVASWTITNIDSTNLTVASQAIPAGMSLSGGGYPGRLSANALAYTLSNGAAVVVYEV